MTSPDPAAAGQNSPQPAAGWTRRFGPVLIILLAGLAVRLPLLPREGFRADQSYFAWWGYAASTLGFDVVYRDYDFYGHRFRRCNIPPLNHFGFWTSAKLYPLVAGRAMGPEDVRAAYMGEPRDAANR